MTKHERTELIRQYKHGYGEVAEALKGITPEELDFRRAPKKWSSREIVTHLADSETTSGIRLRKLLCEHTPYIQGYDQDEFAKRLRYAKRPIEPALEAIKAARETTAQIFEFMTEQDWTRQGEHAESGPYSAETWLSIYAVHAHNHADQILQNREAFHHR